MAQYLDYAGLSKVLGKIDDTFAKKSFSTYTAAEAQAESKEHLTNDSDNKAPGDEGYVPTYETGYTPVAAGDKYEVKIDDLDSEKEGSAQDGLLTVKVTQEDGVLSAVTVTSTDTLVTGKAAKAESAEGAGDAEAATGVYKYIDDSVAAAQAKTSKAIKVLGGPLADDAQNDWPSDAAWTVDGQKTIPANTSLQDILTKLFFAEKSGTLADAVYVWSPSLQNPPTATLSLTGDQIVGTEVTITYAAVDGVKNNTASASVSVSNGYGYSTDGTTVTTGDEKSVNATAGSTTGTLTATGKWKAGSASAVDVNSGDTKAIVEGTNTLTVSQSGLTAKPGTFSETTVYNVTNTGSVVTVDNKVINEAGFEASSAYGTGSKALAATTKTATVTGYYPYYSGVLDAPITTFDEAAIKQNPTKACPASATTTTASRGYFVAVPASDTTHYGKSTVKLWNAEKNNIFVVASAQTGTVEVTVAGTAKQTYKVFYFCNAAEWGQVQTFPTFEWA